MAHWLAPQMMDLDPQADYRLVFKGTGSRLWTGLYRLDNLEVPVVATAVIDTTMTHGAMGLYFYHRDTGPTGFQITLDNFSLVGTNP